MTFKERERRSGKNIRTILSRNPRKSENLNRVTLEAGIRSGADLISNHRANPLIPSPKIQIKGNQSDVLVIQTQKTTVKTLDQGSKKSKRNGRVRKKREKRKKKLTIEQTSDDCRIEKKQEKSSTKEKNEGGESAETKLQSRSKEETAKGLRSNRKPGKTRRKRLRSEIFTEGYPASHIKVADRLYDISHKHCTKVQAVSCDEAFLDITESEENDPEILASVIRKEIFEATGCTASAGNLAKGLWTENW